MRLLARILLNGLALVAAAHLLPGIHWNGGLVALVVAGCVIGLLNAVVKPIVAVLSCPLIVLTLGLFYLVINGLMLLLADWLLDPLAVDDLFSAIVGGFFLAVWNLAIKLLFEREPAPRAD